MTILSKLAIWRRQHVTNRVFKTYRRLMPTMSVTERDAISAGTVTFEADLFSGSPDWQKLLSFPAPKLTAEEQAFLDGPVNQLCSMIDDWDITQHRADLPPELWQFIKEQGFFGLIIPKEYGGKGFSAYAHSQIIVKVSGLSITVSTTIAVPNSLGPAELLLHYGTEAQKKYYLPRLAIGEEIPCFALTSPDAGSDASAMTDNGVVCEREFEGKKTLGILLNFNKRYITLAPVATVIGLAFKLYDPNHLLGDKEEVGITCALIPRNTKGVSIGRRHYPLSAPFQNGPIKGEDVFIPLDWIIGGISQAGNGWRMLMECLAAGRAITLPSSAVGAAKVVCYTSGAYARIRKQFNTSIGHFEGIEEPLARCAAFTYTMDAVCKFTVAAIDRGEKPSVASAIIKYHTTELGRKVACDAMDIHGGKAICLGPKNYIGRGYQSIPIAITVEGANILTRNMIIFGQGAIRCHPYVLPEMASAHMTDPDAGFDVFDKLIMQHVGFIFKNKLNAFWRAITGSFLVSAPRSKMKRSYQHLSRFSSAFAYLADISMISIGASLKRKESISARLGDILSDMYLLSAVLKEYHDQGEPLEDLPVVEYASAYYLYHLQESFNEVLYNFPKRWLGILIRMVVFPLGQHFNKPSDRLNHEIAPLLMAKTGMRARLTAGIYLSTTHDNVFADLDDALTRTIAAEPIERLIKEAKQQGKIAGRDARMLAQAALQNKIINEEQYQALSQLEIIKQKVIAVDDFTTADLAHGPTVNVMRNDYVD